jgi:site-specific DNA-adenine methylase
LQENISIFGKIKESCLASVLISDINNFSIFCFFIIFLENTLRICHRLMSVKQQQHNLSVCEMTKISIKKANVIKEKIIQLIFYQLNEFK